MLTFSRRDFIHFLTRPQRKIFEFLLGIKESYSLKEIFRGDLAVFWSCRLFQLVPESELIAQKLMVFIAERMLSIDVIDSATVAMQAAQPYAKTAIKAAKKCIATPSDRTRKASVKAANALFEAQKEVKRRAIAATNISNMVAASVASQTAHSDLQFAVEEALIWIPNASQLIKVEALRLICEYEEETIHKQTL